MCWYERDGGKTLLWSGFGVGDSSMKCWECGKRCPLASSPHAITNGSTDGWKKASATSVRQIIEQLNSSDRW